MARIDRCYNIADLREVARKSPGYRTRIGLGT